MEKEIEFYMKRAAKKAQNYDLSGALEDYDIVIELDDNNEKAYYLRGCINNCLGYYLDALLDFNKILELNPESKVEDREKQVAVRGLSHEAKSEEDLYKLSRFIDKYTYINGIAIGSYFIGNNDMRAKRYKDAFDNYSRAIKYKNNYAAAYFGRSLAVALMNDAINTESVAIEQYDKAVGLSKLADRI